MTALPLKPGAAILPHLDLVNTRAAAFCRSLPGRRGSPLPPGVAHLCPLEWLSLQTPTEKGLRMVAWWWLEGGLGTAGNSCLGMGTVVAWSGQCPCVLPKPNTAKQAVAPAQLGEEQRVFYWEFTIFSRHAAACPTAGTMCPAGLAGLIFLFSILPLFFLLLPSLLNQACPSHL